MGKVKFTNNAYGHITQVANPGDMVLQLDDVSLFPALGAEDWCYVSLDQEVVKVIDIDQAALTMTLDPADSINQSHIVQTTVELRMCRELLDDMGDMGEF